MINNQTLVILENVRDPGSQLYHRILYVFGMTPKLTNLLRRLRNFTEEQIDDHINWFNDSFQGTVTRVKEIKYAKSSFGPRMSGLHQHKKLIDAKSVVPNENKFIQEWVDEEIKYPYTPMDLGNRKYKQTITQAGFTENVLAGLAQNGLTPAQVDKHIRMVRNRFGFIVGKAGSRKRKHTPPTVMPNIVFVEEGRRSTPTTSSATHAKSLTSLTTPVPGTSTEATDTMEQTIGMVMISDPGTSSEHGGQLPIISTVFSMATMGDTEELGEEQDTELEYVSTVMQNSTFYDPKEQLASYDLKIEKELVEDDLQPGDPEYYPRLQYVYRNLQRVEKAVNASKNTSCHADNMRKYNSMPQIFKNMKTAYSYHAK